MADKSAIEWTDATWSTVYGCTKVSPACAHCYIERSFPYRMAGLKFDRGRIPVQLLPERLDAPLRWTRPRMIFVNSLGDTFHEDVPDSFLDQLFAVMALAPQHTFQLLTKRPERMREYFTTGVYGARWVTIEGQAQNILDRRGVLYEDVVNYSVKLPLRNVWLGVTAENQRWADKRIPELLATPAAVRWVSCEPLLSAIDLQAYLPRRSLCGSTSPSCLSCGWPEDRQIHGAQVRQQHPDELKIHPYRPSLNWVVAGGESAGPARRRLVDGPFDIVGHERYLPKPQAYEWVTSLRDQCASAGAPFFFKQWGGPWPKAGGRMLDGREWNEMPGGVKTAECTVDGGAGS